MCHLQCLLTTPISPFSPPPLQVSGAWIPAAWEEALGKCLGCSFYLSFFELAAKEALPGKLSWVLQLGGGGVAVAACLGTQPVLLAAASLPGGQLAVWGSTRHLVPPPAHQQPQIGKGKDVK